MKDKDTEAMWLLGLCYEYGMGCEQDLEEAQSLYKQSSYCRNVIGKMFLWNETFRRGTGMMKLRGM